ncbi:MAG: putative ABC transporter permease [Ruminococcus sp.]
MNLFLTLAFLFCIGSVVGWGIEVIFRRFFSAHHWVNPGFLVGPYLPLYGSSLCILFLLAMLEPLIPIENAWLKKLILFVVMAVAITILEYVAGMIFIHGMKIKLWDYSDQWGNIKGVICPLFSFFWMILSAIYYFLVHPHILSALKWLSENLAFSFAIGFFYGVFVLDVAYSTRLMVKIRAFAAETNIVVRLEELKEDFRARLQNGHLHRFFFPMHTVTPMREILESHLSQHSPVEKRHTTRKKEKKSSVDSTK